MTALSDYVETALLNEVLRGTNFVPPTAWYLALFISPTTDGGGGTEVSGGSYARQPVTFGVPSDGVTMNTNLIVYTNLPAGTISHTAILDGPVGGNMLVHGPLQNPRVLAAADGVTFVPGAIAVNLD